MGRDRDPFRLPRAGLEIAPLAGLMAVPLGGSAGAVGNARLLSGSTLGAVGVFAIYQALLSGLRTEALVRRGAIDRRHQAQLVIATAWESMKDGAAVGLALSLVLLVLPALSLPIGVLSVVGLGKASLDLGHAFWDGLSDQQRRELHAAAYAAGVNLHRLLLGPDSGLAAAA